ncbi:MAG: hypothetical protein ACKOE6_03290 [Flammeovirgaceae bacterium]
MVNNPKRVIVSISTTPQNYEQMKKAAQALTGRLSLSEYFNILHARHFKTKVPKHLDCAIRLEVVFKCFIQILEQVSTQLDYAALRGAQFDEYALKETLDNMLAEAKVFSKWIFQELNKPKNDN